MFVRSVLLFLSVILVACSSTTTKPLDIKAHNAEQAQIEATDFKTLTLNEIKAKYSEPDLAEELIINSADGLKPYQANPHYANLLSQLNSDGEVVLIHAVWQRYQHETDVLYYQQTTAQGDMWQPLNVELISTVPTATPAP